MVISAIWIAKDAANPDNYNKCGNLGNLADYIGVAQSIIRLCKC